MDLGAHVQISLKGAIHVNEVMKNAIAFINRVLY